MSCNLPITRYQIDGHWLETARIEARRPDLPTIVMLHEALGSIAHWKDFPCRLAEAAGAAIFLYSRYGHGGSDERKESRPVNYMHYEGQVVLPELLRVAGIEHPVLFGHSDGASIAITYAGTFPDAAAGLILEAPHVFVEAITLSSIAYARGLYETTDLPQRLGRYHTHVDSLFRGWIDIWLDPSFHDWNIESFLDPIRCPVLLLQGAQDEYGTTKQIEAIQARIPTASATLLDNCRHSPHREHAETVLTAVKKFLESRPGATIRRAASVRKPGTA